ncbi:PdxS/SNZ N-terminal domain [Dillenia turbinata]|uniref:PdxS/SNZ N-terminal domain n=1 Tax=Dillenia turbinata TaxID=194707 RepID=A0AAN8YT68_9MAGN
MADEGVVGVYNNNAIADSKKTPFSIKVGMAQMLRGGAIIEVLNSEQAKIAESAGACSVLISQRSHHPNAVYRMSEPSVIKEIKTGSLNPVMAKARVGHFVEAQILEAIGVDYIDESEVLTIADDENFINKHKLTTPFVCAGGIVTPADAALMMQLGCDGIFVVRHYNDPIVLAEASSGLEDAMAGLDLSEERSHLSNLDLKELYTLVCSRCTSILQVLTLIVLAEGYFWFGRGYGGTESHRGLVVKPSNSPGPDNP